MNVKNVILVSGILGGIFPHPIVISMLSGINQILICDKHQIPRSLIANHILGLKMYKYKSALANIDITLIIVSGIGHQLDHNH